MGALMKRVVAPIVALGLTIAVVVGASGVVRIEWVENVLAQLNNIPPPNANCSPDGTDHLNGQKYPTTIEPEFSIWCYTQPVPLPATRVSGANDWVDTFDNNGNSITQFNDHDMGYRVFDQFIAPANSFARGYFINVNHWMIDLDDISPYALSGGVLVSPDKQFKFENGTVVIEADAAAGSDGMGGANLFYEIDVSPATAPTGSTVDALYGYGAFGYIGAVGCRLERNDQGGNFVCAMYDNSGRATDGRCVGPYPCTSGAGGYSGRVWETQGVGTARTASSVQGGYPDWPIPGTNLHLRDVWRQCATNELDLHCRDRFRMEITKDSIHLFVNGYQAMLIDGLFAKNPDSGADNRIPDFWFTQGVRPYLTSWQNGGQHYPTRWHWDRIAMNPHDSSGNFAAPSASPSFCLGQPNNTCPDPTGTPTAATATPTSPPATATATRTPAPTSPPGTATATPPASTSGSMTINFDNLSNPNRPLSGQYPTGVADWGTNLWYLSGPFGSFPNNSVSFNGAGPTSAPIRFLSASRVLTVDAYNGGGTTTTVSLSCAGLPTVQRTVNARQLITIQTGWSGTCTTLTVGSSNGWDTNFDNLSIASGSTATPTATPTPAPNQTVDFNNLSNPNRALSGQYPTGVIDWGTNGWYLSGPYGAFTTNSVSFNGAGMTSQGFGFVSPRKLVQVEAYNGGSGSSTITLGCAGQQTRTYTLAAHTLATLVTNWSGTCNTVTVTSSNGWDTNFDNFVIQ